jgi:predicted aspartyl protease
VIPSAVRSTRFPYLSVHVRLGNLQYPDFEFDVDALVDTGFSSGLTVPQGLIPSRVEVYP